MQPPLGELRKRACCCRAEERVAAWCGGGPPGGRSGSGCSPAAKLCCHRREGPAPEPVCKGSHLVVAHHRGYLMIR